MIGGAVAAQNAAKQGHPIEEVESGFHFHHKYIVLQSGRDRFFYASQGDVRLERLGVWLKTGMASFSQELFVPNDEAAFRIRQSGPNQAWRPVWKNLQALECQGKSAGVGAAFGNDLANFANPVYIHISQKKQGEMQVFVFYPVYPGMRPEALQGLHQRELGLLGSFQSNEAAISHF